MARAAVKEGLLRGCPTCGTRVADADLGLRDFAWVNEALGNKLGLMDLDGVLTQASTGRMLVLEMKPRGAYITTGARLTFALLVKAGYQCWVLWDQGNGRVKFSELNEAGRPVKIRELLVERVARLVSQWWDEGLA